MAGWAGAGAGRMGSRRVPDCGLRTVVGGLLPIPNDNHNFTAVLLRVLLMGENWDLWPTDDEGCLNNNINLSKYKRTAEEMML